MMHNLISSTCDDSLIPGFTSIAEKLPLQGHSGPLDFLANLTQSMHLVLHKRKALDVSQTLRF